MDGYYVVMCSTEYGPEEYTGHRWALDQDLEAQEELWDARHDGNVSDAYIKEVVRWQKHKK